LGVHHLGDRSAQNARQRRQQDQHQNGSQIFDDQPADRDATVHAVEHTTRFQRLEQHNGTGARQRQPENQTGSPTPSPPPGDGHAEYGGQAHLHDGAGHRNAFDRQQVIERKMQADAEHEQHDADFGELGSQMDIGHESRCTRPDDDAGHKVAHQCRHFDALGEEAKDERNAEAGRQRGDQGYVVFHCRYFTSD
jgi:hypothetical protein